MKKIILILLTLVIAIPASLFGYLYFKINSMYDKEGAQEVAEKITKEKEINGVTNILLAGVDGDNLEKGNRSDSMMILTIDSQNNDIRITSLARDTYVDIPGHSTEKLTHAYAYGGQSLLLETIKNNFGINIDKYVVVNFDSFIKIIDIIGGVEINILDREVSHIPGVDNSGIQTLTGKQALAYSRIRYADDAYQRDNRQRNVIQAAFAKIKQQNNFLEVGNSVLKYVKTNITPLELISLGNKVIKINDTQFDQIEFPFEGHREGKTLSKEKGWVILWDKEYNLEQLNKFIFDYENYK